MQRFGDYEEMHDHWQASYRHILTSVINVETRLEQHRQALKKEDA